MTAMIKWLGGRNQDCFVTISYSCDSGSGIVLFESGLEFTVNVYCKLQGNHEKGKQWIIVMLRKERKWSHIKMSVKTTNGRKRVEDKKRKEDQGQ